MKPSGPWRYICSALAFSLPCSRVRPPLKLRDALLGGLDLCHEARVAVPRGVVVLGGDLGLGVQRLDLRLNACSLLALCRDGIGKRRSDQSEAQNGREEDEREA